ncbi:MAG: phosphotransferase [Chryseolinea sp.]
MNHLYVVTTPTTKYVFRIYTMDWRTRSEISEEIRLLNHLKLNNIPVAFPIADNQGNFIQSFNAPEGERFGVLFSYAEGKKISALTPAACLNIGKAMASMHKLTKDFELSRTDYSGHTLLINSYQKSTKFYGTTSEEMLFVDKASKYLIGQYTKVKTDEVRHGVIHLDIWFDNMHINDDNQITLFDFDFCGNGWQCHDLAYFMVQLYNSRKSDETHTDNLKHFLKGYESVSKISQEEKRIIPFLAVSIWFFYLGVQCDRFDYWTNIYLTEDHLKRFISLIKKWMEYNNIAIPD